MNQQSKSKIILIVGFEASGKTELSIRLAERMQPCHVHNDFLQNHGNFKSISSIYQSKYYDLIRDSVVTGDNLILNDVTLCYPGQYPRIRNELTGLAPSYMHFSVFFENNPEASIRNAQYRFSIAQPGTRDLHADLFYIRERAKVYKPYAFKCESDIVIPTFDSELNNDSTKAVVSHIAQWEQRKA